MDSNTVIPALPSGFQLDASGSGSALSLLTIPSLPPGFNLDQQSPVLSSYKTAGDLGQAGDATLLNTLLSKANTRPNGAQPGVSGVQDVQGIAGRMQSGFNSTSQLADVVKQALTSPTVSPQNMQSGIGRALTSQLTPVNLGGAIVGGSLLSGLADVSMLGKALVAGVLTKLGVSGAQQAGSSLGAASVEPAGGQRREDIANAVLSAGQALPIAFGKQVGEHYSPDSSVNVDASTVPNLSDIEKRGDAPIQMGNKGADQLNVMQDTGKMLMQPGQLGLHDLIESALGKQKLAQVLQTPARQIPERVGSPMEIAQDKINEAINSDAQMAKQPPIRVDSNGTAITPEQSNTFLPTNTSDIDKYKSIQNQMTQMIQEGKTGTPEFSQLWKDMEEVKNRNGGMTPAENKITSQSSSIGKGLLSAVEQNKESGSINLPSKDELVDKAHNLIQGLSTKLRQGKVKANMASDYDAIHNISNNLANQAANTIRGSITRSLGVKVKELSLAEDALSTVREANGNKEVLQQQLNDSESLEGKPMGKQWVAAAEYGIKNWDKLNSLASDNYAKFTDNIFKQVGASGKELTYREGYVRHLPESESGASFTHSREYTTLFDRIKSGSNPKSINSVDLLRTSVADANRLYIQSKAYIDALSKTKDPRTDKPIAIPIQQFDKIKDAKGDLIDQRPPKGYEDVRIGGQHMAVLKDYAPTINALTDVSWFSKSPNREALMDIAGLYKHITFAFDLMHLTRMALVDAGVKVGTGNLPNPLNYKQGLFASQYSMAELARKVEAGDLTKDEYTQALEDKKIISIGLKTGFNAERYMDAAHQSFADKIPVTGSFQRWLFNNFTKGAMYDSYPIVFKAYKAQHPELSDIEVGRKVSHDLNITFRSLGKQGLIRSATGQDMFRLVIAAPQWTEGTIKLEGQAMGGAAKSGAIIAKNLLSNPIETLKNPALRPISIQTRVLGAMTLGYVVYNQLVNYATTGHSTFENEDGHKLDAFIPGGKGGFYLSPIAMPFEAAHALSNALGREGGEAGEALRDYIDPKLSGLARLIATWATGKQWGLTGPEVKKGDLPKAVLENAIPLPIGVKSVINPQQGTTEKQVLKTLGMNVDAAGSNQPYEKKSKGRKNKYTITK